MTRFSLRQSTRQRRYKALTREWQWSLDLTGANDDLVAPKLHPPAGQWIHKGTVPELVVDEAPVVIDDDGAPYRTFDGVAGNGGVFLFSMYGKLGKHDCRMNQYRVDLGGSHPEDVTALLLDIGSLLRIPWMKATRPSATKRAPLPWSAPPFRLPAADGSWHIEARNNSVATDVFGDPSVQRQMTAIGEQLLSVEIGSHWLLIRSKQAELEQVRALRQAAVEVARAIPLGVMRRYGNPSAVSQDQYDLTTWRRLTADRLHEPPAERFRS